MIQQLLALLKTKRFSLENEKLLQAQIAAELDASGIAYRREVALDAGSIIDFMVGDIGVEVKIGSSKKQIHRQCGRYCQFPEVTRLLVITNKQLGLPTILNGKPTHLLNLGLAWL